MAKHQMLVTQHEQMVVAGKPQMLLMGSVGDRDEAFHHVLWCCGALHCRHW